MENKNFILLPTRLYDGYSRPSTFLYSLETYETFLFVNNDELIPAEYISPKAIIDGREVLLSPSYIGNSYYGKYLDKSLMIKGSKVALWDGPEGSDPFTFIENPYNEEDFVFEKPIGYVHHGKLDGNFSIQDVRKGNSYSAILECVNADNISSVHLVINAMGMYERSDSSNIFIGKGVLEGKTIEIVNSAKQGKIFLSNTAVFKYRHG